MQNKEIEQLKSWSNMMNVQLKRVGVSLIILFTAHFFADIIFGEIEPGATLEILAIVPLFWAMIILTFNVIKFELTN
jgi:energy-converting hydrogenase Eha subunit E